MGVGLALPLGVNTKEARANRSSKLTGPLMLAETRYKHSEKRMVSFTLSVARERRKEW